MGSRSGFSVQTLSVLAALCEEPSQWRLEEPSQWRHGYTLARQTGLKSGTLYPILIRLADRGLVEACWQDEATLERSQRHLYRLTADGLASATGALAAAARSAVPSHGPSPGPLAGRPGARRRSGRGVAAPAVP
jgi:PadR family transcriptional regulator PadR